MYCITINNSHFEKIKRIGYLPVGLGDNIKNKNFYNDKVGENISRKNPYYGEYCQYRKFWSLKNKKISYNTLNEFKENIIEYIPEEFSKYESILGQPLYINQFRLSKFIKKGFFKIIKNPLLLLIKKKRNIKFHFDLMHGEGNLDKAIRLLDINDRSDFNYFVNSEISFNPHNMFICKSNETLEKYYNSVFPWLTRCEKEFGFNLEGYGLKRIYGFLAERYMSFWFQKYTKFKTLPITFKDISDLN